MINENEIKRAFAMEVIEKFKAHWVEYYHKDEVLQTIQSLLPKEEEVDWSKVSDEELKKESEKYIGKTVRCIDDTKIYLVTEFNKITNAQSLIMNSNTGGEVLVFDRGKWAEIVEPDTNIEINQAPINIQELFEKTEITTEKGHNGTNVHYSESNFEKTKTGHGNAEFELHETTPQMQEAFKKANPEMRFSESDEVKVGDEVVLSVHGGAVYTVIALNGEDAWVEKNHDLVSKIVARKDLCKTCNIKEEPTLEQKARKKAEEIYDKMWVDISDRENEINAIKDLILFDPKTL